MSTASPVLRVIPTAGNRLKVSTSTMRLGLTPGPRWSMKVVAPTGSANLAIQPTPQINFRSEQSLLNLEIQPPPIVRIILQLGGFGSSGTSSFAFHKGPTNPTAGIGNDGDLAYNETTGGWLYKQAGAWGEFHRGPIEITTTEVKFVTPSDGVTRSALIGNFP